MSKLKETYEVLMKTQNHMPNKFLPQQAGVRDSAEKKV